MYYDSKDPVLEMTYRDHRICYHATKKLFFCNEEGVVSDKTFDNYSGIKTAIDATYKKEVTSEKFYFDSESPGRIASQSKLMTGKIVAKSPRRLQIEDDAGNIHSLTVGTYFNPKFLTLTVHNVKILEEASALEQQIEQQGQTLNKLMDSLTYFKY